MASNLRWTFVFSERAKKEFGKLDSSIQKRVQQLILRIIASDDPKKEAKPLTGTLKHLYRYRVGDYRVICTIHDRTLTICAVSIAHRRESYK